MFEKTVFSRGAWLLLGAPIALACASASDGTEWVGRTQQALSSAQLPAALRVFGQPDLKQTNYNEVVANRPFYPAGVLVDRDPSTTVNSHVYVFDSGNVVSSASIPSAPAWAAARSARPALKTHFARAAAARSTPAKTQNSRSVNRRPRHRGLQRRHTSRAAASTSSLCLVPYPAQVSPLEGPRGGQLARDTARNLYVVDTFNNRVLKYNNPFATGADTLADWQFGQTGMTGRLCNQGTPARPPRKPCARARSTSCSTGYFSRLQSMFRRTAPKFGWQTPAITACSR